ncbi:protein SHQ1 [Fistulifera solaris]|jgi:protein SHQ1|uniref:Protein SHQ1 n=1 Tax=Fistulifera solaris TaxID=1519565 RepID=A0A1Z5KPA1_FISSO|nr:protein SHQ1 [Fistulifera solaris]|eukprot:GAX28106.1 protein SHQ1 [Fistulifera solaris]
MPITPRFHLSQDETDIILRISVPHFRVSSETIQVVITDDSILHFSSSPYLLVLNFSPHRFAEQADEACAQYEIATKELVLRLRKAQEHEMIWDNLHLLGQLVSPKSAVGAEAPWLQKVVASTEVEDIPTEDTTSALDGYGFMNMFQNIYETLAREEASWLEVPWNSSESREERRRKRIVSENECFDQERYLQDLDVSDDYIYQNAVSFIPFWTETIEQQLDSLSLQSSAQGFSDQEQQDLLSIPYPILPQTTKFSSRSLLMNLLDILFAYVYDHLTTDGEPTVESAWTVTKLSASLSCLEDWSHDTVETVMISSCRRTLLYPYLRNMDLACLCWQHVSNIIPSVDHIVRALLQLRNILLKTDQYHYLSNQIWIDPYLAWIQRENDALVKDLRYLYCTVQEVLKKWKEDPSSLKEALQLGVLELEQSLNTLGESEEEDDDDDSADFDSGSSGEDDDDCGGESEVLSVGEAVVQRRHVSDALLDSKINESKLFIVKNLL